MISVVFRSVHHLLLLQIYLSFNLVSSFSPQVPKVYHRTSTRFTRNMGTQSDNEIKTVTMNPKDAKGVIFDIDGRLEELF
jgi:hypothetical protein